MKRPRPFLLALAPLLLLGNGDPMPQEGTLKVRLGEVEFGPGDGRREMHYQLVINARGKVSHCRVVRSSGDALFDNSVCKELKRNSTYDRSGGMFTESQRYDNGYFFAEPPGKSTRNDQVSNGGVPPGYALPADTVSINVHVGDDGKVDKCEWAEEASESDPWMFCEDLKENMLKAMPSEFTLQVPRQGLKD